MATKGQLKTAAQRGTVHRRDDRFAACLDSLDDGDTGRLAGRPAELRNVRTSHEGAAGTCDHDCGNSWIVDRTRYEVEEADPNLVFHGINRRIVDRDDRNVAVSPHANKLRHDAPRSCRGCRA